MFFIMPSIECLSNVKFPFGTYYIFEQNVFVEGPGTPRTLYPGFSSAKALFHTSIQVAPVTFTSSLSPTSLRPRPMLASIAAMSLVPTTYPVCSRPHASVRSLTSDNTSVTKTSTGQCLTP